MSWIFGFFGKNTRQHSGQHNTSEPTIHTEQSITNGMIKAYEQIHSNEKAEKDLTAKEKQDAWNQLTGYKEVPQDICLLGKIGCDIHNTWVVLWKSLWLKRTDIHSNIVIRNDAQQRLLSQLRSRKWTWYGGALFALCVTCAAIKVSWLLMLLFAAYTFICFVRGRALRIAMFEAERITDLAEICTLHSLYTSSSGNLWSAASVIVGIATICYPEEMKSIIDTMLKTFSR